MWLYPVPPVLALVGFIYILTKRANSGRELVLAGVVVAVGAAAYWARQRFSAGKVG
jgi:APA family basic amino acid/polyamine antiporter